MICDEKGHVKENVQNKSKRNPKAEKERNLKLYSTIYCSSYCFCCCDRIIYMLTGKSNTRIKTNVLM